MKSIDDIAALEAMIGQFMSYRLVALRGAAALRRQYPGIAPVDSPECRLAVLQAAADCWGNAATMASEVLAKRRGK